MRPPGIYDFMEECVEKILGAVDIDYLSNHCSIKCSERSFLTVIWGVLSWCATARMSDCLWMCCGSQQSPTDDYLACARSRTSIRLLAVWSSWINILKSTKFSFYSKWQNLVRHPTISASLHGCVARLFDLYNFLKFKHVWGEKNIKTHRDMILGGWLSS